MGIAFWVRRAATVFAIVAIILFVVSLLKGRGLVGSAEFAATWATAAAAVFTVGRLYQSRRGQHCELCQDIPVPLVDSEAPPPGAVELAIAGRPSAQGSPAAPSLPRP